MVLVELTGSIVPPRELRRVGVVIAGKVDEPEFKQPADGVAFGWAGVSASSPPRRVIDITISGATLTSPATIERPSAARAAEAHRGGVRATRV